MKIIERFCTKSDCYQAKKKIDVKGLMLHSVGCPQPKAENFINNWDKPGAKACAHAIIEASGEVYQLLPWNHRGWHAGGAANDSYIGVEMTEPDTIQYLSGSKWKEMGDGKITKMHVLATYRHAVELFAYLCHLFQLDPIADGVILSHSEAHQRKMASNHGDVEHLWQTHGLSMAQFREDVWQAMKEKAKKEEPMKEDQTGEKPYFRVRTSWEDKKSQKGAFHSCERAKQCADNHPGYYVFTEDGVPIYPEMIKRNTLLYGKLKYDMNIRTGASIEDEVLAIYPKGSIVDIVSLLNNGWYQIRASESSSGYAYLSNVNRAYVSEGHRVYTVKRGDSLWKIAQNVLGSGIRYQEIKRLNGLQHDTIVQGQQLLLP